MVLEPRLESYLTALNQHADPVAHAMEAAAEARGFPIVGPIVGRLLYQLVLLHRPRRVFELGSGFGYSALWFASAMQSAGLDGEVVLTDGSAVLLEEARGYLDEAGLTSRCAFRKGDALETLRDDRGGEVDLFFVDVDKELYPFALGPMMERLRPGGLIVVDNMLWKGLPYAAEDDSDGPTRGVVGLTRRLFEHADLFTTLLPIRDGVTVSIRRR